MKLLFTLLALCLLLAPVLSQDSLPIDPEVLDLDFDDSDLADEESGYDAETSAELKFMTARVRAEMRLQRPPVAVVAKWIRQSYNDTLGGAVGFAGLSVAEMQGTVTQLSTQLADAVAEFETAVATLSTQLSPAIEQLEQIEIAMASKLATALDPEQSYEARVSAAVEFHGLRLARLEFYANFVALRASLRQAVVGFVYLDQLVASITVLADAKAAYVEATGSADGFLDNAEVQAAIHAEVLKLTVIQAQTAIYTWYTERFIAGASIFVARLQKFSEDLDAKIARVMAEGYATPAQLRSRWRLATQTYRERIRERVIGFLANAVDATVEITGLERGQVLRVVVVIARNSDGSSVEEVTQDIVHGLRVLIAAEAEIDISNVTVTAEVETSAKRVGEKQYFRGTATIAAGGEDEAPAPRGVPSNSVGGSVTVSTPGEDDDLELDIEIETYPVTDDLDGFDDEVREMVRRGEKDVFQYFEIPDIDEEEISAQIQALFEQNYNDVVAFAKLSVSQMDAGLTAFQSSLDGVKSELDTGLAELASEIEAALPAVREALAGMEQNFQDSKNTELELAVRLEAAVRFHYQRLLKVRIGLALAVIRVYVRTAVITVEGAQLKIDLLVEIRNAKQQYEENTATSDQYSFEDLEEIYTALAGVAAIMTKIDVEVIVQNYYAELFVEAATEASAKVDEAEAELESKIQDLKDGVYAETTDVVGDFSSKKAEIEAEIAFRAKEFVGNATDVQVTITSATGNGIQIDIVLIRDANAEELSEDVKAEIEENMKMLLATYTKIDPATITVTAEISAEAKKRFAQEGEAWAVSSAIGDPSDAPGPSGSNTPSDGTDTTSASTTILSVAAAVLAVAALF
jgi:ribosomal protein L24